MILWKIIISIDLSAAHEKEVLNGFCKTPNDRVEYVHDIFLQKSYNPKKKLTYKLPTFNEDDVNNDEIACGIYSYYFIHRRRGLYNRK